MPNDQHLRTDLQLVLRHSELRPVYVVGTTLTARLTPSGPRRVLDVPPVTGSSNLGQAIVLRLLTPLGELDSLAHPDYGSRLHELIGRPNTDTTRNLVRLYILDSLRAEARIEKVLDLHVTPSPDPRRRDVVQVSLRVKPVGDVPPLSVGPLGLELQP
jgi:phage baseplate assembly protein W